MSTTNQTNNNNNTNTNNNIESRRCPICSISGCHHLQRQVRDYETFLKNSFGMAKLSFGDFDVYGNWKSISYQRTPPISAIKVVKNRCKKILEEVHIQQEDFEEVLKNYGFTESELDERKDNPISQIISFYEKKKRIILCNGSQSVLSLVLADSEGEPCIDDMATLRFILNQFENCTFDQFTSWYIRYLDGFGNPCFGSERSSFFVLHPELFGVLATICLDEYPHVTDLVKALNKLAVTKKRLAARVKNATMEELNAQLQVEAIRNRVKGTMLQIQGLQQGIAKARCDQNNNLRVTQLENMLAKCQSNLTSKQQQLDKLFATLPSAHPAMDAETKAEIPSENDQATNTAIATTDIEQPTVIIAAPPNLDYVDEIISDVSHKYPTLTDRWTLFDTIPLNETITKGTIIKQYHLPADFVIAKWLTPNMLPFRSHEFFSGSMTLKLQCNIPKTNQFYLRHGTVYHWLQRDRRNELINPWCISQQPGGRINGHLVSSDEISIKFASYVSTIPILPNTQMLNLYYATISLIAMTDFEIATDGIDTAELNVYAKFEPDLRFYGQREVSDEIPNFTIPQQSAIPTAHPAMMIGGLLAANKARKGVKSRKEPQQESGNSLASDFLGSLVGSANRLISGSVRQATRGLNDRTESFISQALAALGSNRDKPTNFHNSVFHQRAITNLASGSGTFEADSYRLQEVGSTPHPDFLLGVEKYDSIKSLIETEGFVNSTTVLDSHTQGQLLASLSVQPGDINPMYFGGNFPTGIANWTPMDHLAGWFYNYHGKIHFRFECVADGFKTCRLRVVYVPNKRTITFEESNSLYFQTFDLGSSLDTQQSFDFITPYINPQINFQSRSSDGTPYFAGSVHLFLEVKINAPANLYPSFDILVFKRASPDEMLYSVPRSNTSLVKLDSSNLPDLPGPPPPVPDPPINFPFTLSTRDFSVEATLWSCTLDLTTAAGVQSRTVGTLSGTSIFLLSGSSKLTSTTNSNLVFNNPDLDRDFVIFVGPTTPQVGIICQLTFDTGTETISIPTNDVLDGTVINWSIQAYGSIPVVTSSDEVDMPTVHPSGDIREAYTDSSDLVGPISLVGPALHGEDHMHLYENLRRFEHYHTLSTLAPQADMPVRIFSIPLNFGTPVYREFLTRIERCNKLTQLHDCMRYTRSSLRHIYTISGPPQGIIRVVHKPQQSEYPFTVADQTAPELYTDPGLGETIISLQQNNVAAHEFPMYLPTVATLNATYLSDEVLTKVSRGLGTADFYWQGPESPITINILRAFGDDGQMYMFNGFPLREARYDNEPLDFYTVPTATPAGLLGGKLEEDLSTTSKRISSLATTIEDFLNRMFGGGGSEELLGTLITQIAHVVVNPTVKTFALSVTQMLISLRIISMKFLSVVTERLEAVYRQVMTIYPAGGGDIASDIDEVAGLSSVLVASICAFFSPNVQKTTGFTDKMSLVFTTGANMHVRTLEFIKSILTFCKKVAIFICGKFFPTSNLLSYLDDRTFEVWMDRVNILTDSTNLIKLKKNRKAISVVYKCTAQGESLVKRLAQTRHSALLSTVSQSLTRLKNVRDKIGLNGHVPSIKYDPFCFYIGGTGSQIGKSHLLKEIILEVLAETNIEPTNRGDPVYVVPESDKWWSGYDGHTALIFDDFMRTKPNEVNESDCARLCSAKGSAAWEVPKPFDDKGAICVAKVIACASNHIYPKVNGILRTIVWARRNLLFSVEANMHKYAKCRSCPVFSFGCAICKSLNNENLLKTRVHLSFQQLDPVRVGVKIGEPLTFTEMKKIVILHAKLHVQQEDSKYEQSMEEMRKYTEDPRFSAIQVPSTSSEQFNQLLTDEEFQEAIGEVPTTAFPSGFFGDVFNFLRNKQADEDEDQDGECIHQWAYDNLVEPVYHKHDYYWERDNVYASSQPCTNCSWADLESTFFKQVAERYKPDDYPENFPARFIKVQGIEQMVLEERDNLSRKPWFERYSGFLKTVGIGLTVVGAFFTFKRLFTDSEIKTKIFKQSKSDQSNMVATHPALMTSGDIKTRFVPRLRQSKMIRSMRPPSVAKPASDDELASLIKTYEESILELSVGNESIVVRAVSIASKFYITQLHSFASLITFASNKLMDAFNSGVNCVDCEEEHGTTNHSPTCVEKNNKVCCIQLKKRNRNGGYSEKQITLAHLFEMNRHTFGVDSAGSDCVTFFIDIKDFTTNNIQKYLVSETNEHIDERNFQFYDPQRIGMQGVQYPTENVQTACQHIKYESESVQLWAPGASAIPVLLHGYKCKNPVPTGLKTSCGSVLIDKTTCTIVGLMSAVCSQYLYFNALSHEQTLESFNWFDQHVNDGRGKKVVLKAENSKRIHVPAELDTCPQATSAMQVHHTTKTTIVKSACFEKFGPVKRIPANLSQNGDKGQTAIQNGLKQYIPHHPFPPQYISASIDHVKQMFNSYCIPAIEPRSKRSIQEAVCGIEGHIARLTISTGPGFPWCCHSETKRKTDLLEFDANHHLIKIDSYLYDEIMTDEELMSQGETPLTIFQISLKDERLPINKVNNVRLIQGSPLGLTISSRRYLMDFNYAFQHSRKRLEHCVGINPFSLDWHDLAIDLISFSDKICVGDFSKFGPRLLNQFVAGAYDVMTEWYAQFNPPREHQQIRRQLGNRVINSHNIFFDTIIELKCGSPSGAINTVIVNSICNMFYIRCAWQGIMYRVCPELGGLHNFEKYVRFFCYGDDVIFAVKNEIIEIFNNQTISEYFAQYDVKYTDVDKGDGMRKYCSIEEASFLKCGFKFYTETTLAPGVWIPQPDLGDLMDTTNWVRKPKGTKSGSDVSLLLIDGAISNCEDAIRKTWFHGRKAFSEFQDNVRTFWLAQGVQRMPTYFTYDGLAAEYKIPVPFFGSNESVVTSSAIISRKRELDRLNPHDGNCSRKCSHNQKSMPTINETSATTQIFPEQVVWKDHETVSKSSKRAQKHDLYRQAVILGARPLGSSPINRS